MNETLNFCEKCSCYLAPHNDAWTREDAEAKLLREQGEVPHDKRVYVCEHCYKDFQAWKNKKERSEGGKCN